MFSLNGEALAGIEVFGAGDIGYRVTVGEGECREVLLQGSPA